MKITKNRIYLNATGTEALVARYLLDEGIYPEKTVEGQFIFSLKKFSEERKREIVEQVKEDEYITRIFDQFFVSPWNRLSAENKEYLLGEGTDASDKEIAAFGFSPKAFREIFNSEFDFDISLFEWGDTLLEAEEINGRILEDVEEMEKLEKFEKTKKE